MGFIPAPIPFQRTNECEENKHFASFFSLNSLKTGNILPTEFKIIPYDLYCPSVQNVLEARTCATWCKYFVSLVLLKEHVKFVNKTLPPQTQKIRPTRIAAQWTNESMAIIGREENEDVEWADIAEIDDGPKHTWT